MTLLKWEHWGHETYTYLSRHIEIKVLAQFKGVFNRDCMMNTVNVANYVPFLTLFKTFFFTFFSNEASHYIQY